MNIALLDEEFIPLAAAAWKVRNSAYSPYSHFRVGSALLTRRGAVFCGCNVENVSYGLTMCAERCAVGAAVAGGDTDFYALVIVSDSREPISPCGACRQVLAEFAPSLTIRAITLGGKVHNASLADLLPRARTGILDNVPRGTD